MIGIGFQDNHETLAAETITITVRQPWAALIVCGQKQFETTTLPPPSAFIGQRIGIRAAWQRPLGQIGKAAEKEAQDALREAALGEPRYGAVIGSALLRAAWRSTHGLSQHLKVDIDGEVDGSSLPCPRQIALSRREALLGNFSAGRWLCGVWRSQSWRRWHRARGIGVQARSSGSISATASASSLTTKAATFTSTRKHCCWPTLASLIPVNRSGFVVSADRRDGGRLSSKPAR